MTQVHLHAEIGDYASVVLLPGDPNRATRMAERFDGGLAKSRQVTIGPISRRRPALGTARLPRGRDGIGGGLPASHA